MRHWVRGEIRLFLLVKDNSETSLVKKLVVFLRVKRIIAYIYLTELRLVLAEFVYVAEEKNLTRGRVMAVQVQQPLVSTLNPNAPLFVPASVTYSPCVEVVVEDFSLEWWNLVQTCPEFREQWVRDHLPVVEERESFEAEIEEMADFEAFLEEQEEMLELEEALYFSGVDEEDLAAFLEDDFSLSNISQVRDVKLNPKQQAPWFKPVKNLDKVPCKAPNPTKKGAQYRIQQPRAVM